MRILSISGPLHREFGGPPLAATGAAVSLLNIGYQVKMIVCGQSLSDSQQNSLFFDKLSSSGAEVQIFLRRKESKYGTVPRIRELKSLWLDVSKSDFIILHQVYELQYLFVLPILLFLRKRYAVMPHGTLTSYQRKQHRLRKILFFPAIYLLLKASRGIFVATQQESDQLPPYLEGKGMIVGLGIEISEQIYHRSMNFNSTFNILYMGRITKKKRLELALQSFALASKESELLMKFIVCGSGEERDVTALKNKIQLLQIEDVVDFRGWVDFSEKQTAFAESDCFILTSEDENFAIAAAEALAHGLPCILSSNVALSSLVTKYGAGIVFKVLEVGEIKQAIIKISKIDRAVSRSSSLKAASELSWEAVVQKWDSTIKYLMQS